MTMKYLILKAPGGEVPVVFPGSFQHAWVAAQMRPLDVVAAGFVALRGGRPECFGHSTGLHLPSRGAVDSALVARGLEDGTG